MANASGTVTPRMALLLQSQRLALSNYRVTNVSADKRRACVTYMRPQNGEPYCTTYETQIMISSAISCGMKVTCTCKRHIQGILCDHVAAHIQEVGDWQLEQFVHNRHTMQYYKSQYPVDLPEYRVPSFNQLTADEGLYLPVVNSVRKGRPAKNRFISPRESAITKAKKKLKRKNFTKSKTLTSSLISKRAKPNIPSSTTISST